MQTKREYAASLGLAVAGARGRLSREAHAAIEKAISEGKTFSDAVKVAPTPKEYTPKADKPKVEQSTTAQTVGDVSYRYTLDQMFTGTDSAGKVWTVDSRQACRSCGYSLTSHPCNDAQVLIKTMETIAVAPKGR